MEKGTTIYAHDIPQSIKSAMWFGAGNKKIYFFSKKLPNEEMLRNKFWGDGLDLAHPLDNCVINNIKIFNFGLFYFTKVDYSKFDVDMIIS